MPQLHPSSSTINSTRQTFIWISNNLNPINSHCSNLCLQRRDRVLLTRRAWCLGSRRARRYIWTRCVIEASRGVGRHKSRTGIIKRSFLWLSNLISRVPTIQRLRINSSTPKYHNKETVVATHSPRVWVHTQQRPQTVSFPYSPSRRPITKARVLFLQMTQIMRVRTRMAIISHQVTKLIISMEIHTNGIRVAQEFIRLIWGMSL